MQLTDHYKAVRARLNAGAPPKPPAPKLPPPPKPPDLSAAMAEAQRIIAHKLYTGAPAWDRIIKDVCKRHGVTVAILHGRTRTPAHTNARHEAYYRLRAAGYSYNRIAAVMGGKDHTTVMSGIKSYVGKNKDLSDHVREWADLDGAVARGAARTAWPLFRSDEARG